MHRIRDKRAAAEKKEKKKDQPAGCSTPVSSVLFKADGGKKKTADESQRVYLSEQTHWRVVVMGVSGTATALCGFVAPKLVYLRS